MPSQSPLAPGLMMIHGNRMESLRDLMVQWVKQHPLAPLEQEVFLVQSNGMAQWLKLALADDQGLGIAAALEMTLPSRFIWQAYRSVLGKAQVPEVSPFDKPRLKWRLMRLLPELLGIDEFAKLGRFLAKDDDARKREQLAEQLADLFDQYQVYRADWLDAWQQGQDLLIDAKGQCQPLPNDALWQAKLWRAIVADVPENHRLSHRAALHQQFLTQLRNGDAPTGLPRRLQVFGISALPQQTIEALAELGRYCQILLFVQNPCQHFWGDIVEPQSILTKMLKRASQKRKSGAPVELDPTRLHLEVNPLLAAWGKQGRDYLAMLAEMDHPEQHKGVLEKVDLFEPPIDAQNPTLLSRLQQSVFDLEPLPQPKVGIEPEDDSVSFCRVHSRQREIEALQDELLKQFALDKSLTPADIIVMVPDIRDYAPHIEAVFGLANRDDPRYLPFTIADRPEKGRQTLVWALEKLMSLTQLRFGAVELLDLLAVPAVRRRYQLTEEQIPLLADWVEGAGIRWGLDKTHRDTQVQTTGFYENSWLFGLERMLLGYAVGRGDNWRGIEPYQEVGGLDAAILGGLSLFVRDLKAIWHRFLQPMSASDWVEQLRVMIDTVFQAEHEQDLALLAHLEQALADWIEACQDADLTEALPLNIVKSVCMAPFEEAGVSQRFLAGRINFCTLMPMRAIPFKQIAILGLNDGDYPRSRPPLDFDLMGRQALDGQNGNFSPFRPGDRSRREDDRYLFLEAMMSARQRLYLSWIGHDVRDNSVRTPSVLVAQLMDHIRAGYCLEPSELAADEKEKAIIDHLTTTHPLQPFSRRYFGVDGTLSSFATEWHKAYASAPESPLTSLSPWEPEVPVNADDLVTLFRDPIKLLLTRRLQIWLEGAPLVTQDIESFELDGLQRYQHKQAILTELNQSETDVRTALESVFERTRASGQLPVGEASHLSWAPIEEAAQTVHQRAQQLMSGWAPADALECYHKHQDLEFEGWITDLHRHDGQWVKAQTLPVELGNKPEAKVMVRAFRLYIDHLAACAGGVELTSYLVGIDTTWQLLPIGSRLAKAELDTILSAYLAAMSGPMPLAPNAGFALLNAEDEAEHEAETEAEGQQAGIEAAAEAYNGGFRLIGDRERSPYLLRQFSEFEQMDVEHFRHWVALLYAPLWRQLALLEDAAQ